jgi:hypothetical protein
VLVKNIITDKHINIHVTHYKSDNTLLFSPFGIIVFNVLIQQDSLHNRSMLLSKMSIGKHEKSDNEHLFSGNPKWIATC